MIDALVIGGGPAGLMAADILSEAGASVVVTDRMPTLGRKFLMAGRSGLNLTMDEPPEQFLTRFDGLPQVQSAVADFGPEAVKAWAGSLGQEVFTGSSGRVFPTVMKASPLLRAWLERLAGRQVDLRTRWRWTGWNDGAATFDTPEGPASLSARCVVLACGGASWSRLGSDGAWADWTNGTVPFEASNVGLSVSWSPHMARHFGSPVKGCALIVGDHSIRGEFNISARGLEGSGIYSASRAIRGGAALTLDLFPSWSVAEIQRRLASAKKGKSTLANHLRKALRLSPVKLALLQEFGRPLPEDIAHLLKALPVRHSGTRPLDEAISTAGGLGAEAVSSGFAIADRPGVFAAGEMLDWDAPTGGYLITGCLATGRAAGLAAVEHLRAADL